MYTFLRYEDYGTFKDIIFHSLTVEITAFFLNEPALFINERTSATRHVIVLSVVGGEHVINVWNSCLEQLTVEVVDFSSVFEFECSEILSILQFFGCCFKSLMYLVHVGLVHVIDISCC